MNFCLRRCYSAGICQRGREPDREARQIHRQQRLTFVSGDGPLETFLETEVCTGFLDRLERCPVSCWSPPLAPDMTVCGCLLSRSLLGVKRTCRFALHMSAFDPKRTSGLSRCHGSPALI